ncbi:short chain dehydrogenase [Nocardioides szechwanensis]|uniref:Short-chain dehydrogenase n=1 Tax=Nocardioides szechwanensis TaxID=1005944 RepID=A0A1H0E4X1_9ACTN|nr:SDR family NAD(P)-dependent oxidoreductase [Nocardioides szechwanensis]GEP36226.1 short chain dehydrogenase [Nocardioides szechwanensis]SDN77375.1 Short-chain dehydrogenase [Nocardioides szechwanensis]
MTRVLVTGAASGLGAALSNAFETRGDEVLRTDISYEGGFEAPFEARKLAPQDKRSARTSTTARLDITKDDDWAAALAHVEQTWGGLDVLVNNAGVAGGGRLDVATLDEWRWITEINLFGAVRGTRTFVPLLKRQGSGAIVNVASLAGLVHPAGMASYNAVKAAVVALTETTGHELAAHGVTAHVVCPSYFRTNLMSSLQGADTALASVMSKLVESSSISADDIAAAVLEGLDRGDEIIVPDQPARDAYGLKQADRATYDVIMRAQAAKLEEGAR